MASMNPMESLMKCRYTLRAAALIAVAAMATGCAGMGSSKYQCPYSGGVRCMGAIDVYNATEDGTLEAPQEGNASARSTQPQESGSWAGETLVGDDGSLVIAESLAYVDEPRSAPETDSALLQPASVLRVWLAPWEDEHGNLHTAGYVFQEISKRTWRVGNSMPASRPVLQLLDAPVGAGSSP